MDHSLGILSIGVKFALYLVHFMTKFELQKATIFFSYFWLQLVRLKSSKKPCPRFLNTFLLFVILANITFLFPLKSALRNRGHGFAQRLFRQMFTAFKGITSRIF